ncbi:putative membrane protein [Chitinophaga niastensis]|uniref:Putative membrane protein n=1 Tax=Chitinophaga niastensis TaxID=536980 RepID=A0A2P8HC63_CHINA|nr:heparan-alpha-glucosaminide N-acetyltransferase domain-containing protein [Chitinophaga niastensis]PSL43818.1 putative membrane protein [Chitinophaga niastensis]
MSTNTSNRIVSIDILRGIVMIVMALDHTRDYFHKTVIADPLDPATTTVWLYFTRWITHFCAPTFVLLSGMSAYLAAQNRTKPVASLFLIKRGLWLVLMEITIVTLGITFNPSYSFILLQVIWAIGWSMVVLGVLSRISFNTVLIAGLILFFGHNLLDAMPLPASGAANIWWKVLFTSQFTPVPIDANHTAGDFYAIFPWTGIMLLGYCLGYFFRKDADPEKRKRILAYTGASLIVLFIVLRFINSYGNPQPWELQRNFGRDILAFLNTSKYPPSLQFASMTIGPALLAMAFMEHVKGAWARIASVYGSVPFFYYILHFYMLHCLLVIVFFASGHTMQQAYSPNSILGFRPDDFGYGLPVVYGIWLLTVATLYAPCKWFAAWKKARRGYWWLSYV